MANKITKKEANQLYAEALAWQPAQQVGAPRQVEAQSLMQKLLAVKPRQVGVKPKPVGEKETE